VIFFIENQILSKKTLKKSFFCHHSLVAHWLHIVVQQPKSLVIQIGLVIDLTYGDRTLFQLPHGLG
jgi:hypothetical protein